MFFRDWFGYITLKGDVKEDNPNVKILNVSSGIC